MYLQLNYRTKKIMEGERGTSYARDSEVFNYKITTKRNIRVVMMSPTGLSIQQNIKYQCYYKNKLKPVAMSIHEY